MSEPQPARRHRFESLDDLRAYLRETADPNAPSTPDDMDELRRRLDELQPPDAEAGT